MCMCGQWIEMGKKETLTGRFMLDEEICLFGYVCIPAPEGVWFSPVKVHAEGRMIALLLRHGLGRASDV